MIDKKALQQLAKESTVNKPARPNMPVDVSPEANRIVACMEQQMLLTAKHGESSMIFTAGYSDGDVLRQVSHVLDERGIDHKCKSDNRIKSATWHLSWE